MEPAPGPSTGLERLRPLCPAISPLAGQGFTAWFARFPDRGDRDAAVRSLFAEFLAHDPHWRSAVVGGRLDIHVLIGKLPWPAGGFTLPGYRYTGPYNPLERQLDANNKPLPGQEPHNAVDATAMCHDICYHDRGDAPAGKSQCDREMLDELKAIKPRNLRERVDRAVVCGAIGLKYQLGLGLDGGRKAPSCGC